MEQKRLAWLWLLIALPGFAADDTKIEHRMSDQLRNAQRKYIALMEQFSKMCAAKGQQVSNKGAQGDLGCVPLPDRQPPPAPAAAKPQEPPK